MIESLALVAVLLTQVPDAPRIPDALIGPGLLVQATQTHVRAVNESQEAWWLALGITGTDHRILVRVDPGAENVWPLFGGPDDGLVLEALAFSAGELLHTGALSLDALRDADDGALWMRNEGRSTSAFRTRDGRLERLRSDATLTPAARGRGEDGDYEGDMIPSVHVPVVTPGETRGETKPPVIDKRPLPPV